MTKVLYLYSGIDRRELEKKVAAGAEPNTSFFGFTAVRKDPRFDASYLQINKDSFSGLPTFLRRFEIADLLYLYWRYRPLLSAADVIVITSSAYFNLIKLKRWGILSRPRFVLLNLDLTILFRKAAREGRRESFFSLIDTAEAIISLSKVQKEFLATQGFRSEKLTFVPLGTDLDFYQPLERKPQTILTTGRDLGRDFETFLAAARDWPGPVLWSASARHVEEYRDRLPANVKILADLSYFELRECFREAHVFVLALKPGEPLSGSDCSGQTAILDSLAYGVPVVSTWSPWFEGYFEEGVHLVTVPPGDPAALLSAMKRVVDDQELARKLVREGRKLIEETCNSEAMGKAIAGIISEAVSKGPE